MSWRDLLNTKPLYIYYPACGEGEECITACPFDVWEVRPIKASLFGFREKVRLRPVFANPQACRGCFICVEACPTGALRRSDVPVGGRCTELLRFLKSVLRIPFKRYGLRFVFRREHVRRFLKNNWGSTCAS